MASGAPGNVKQAWQFLLGKGLSPAQAAGVIGSMQGESGKGLDPAAVNPNGGATGIAQWLGGRKNAAVLTKQLGPQLNHLWAELQGPESAALRALKGTHTPEAAAVAWQKVFERGAPFEQKYDLRATNAREVFNSLKGTAGSSVLPSSPEQALMGGSGGGTQDSSSGLNAGVAALLAAGQQRPVIQSAGIAAPAFSARPSLPQGAQLPQGGGGPQPSGPDVNSLLALVAGSQQGQDQPAAGSPDAPSQATGPAAGASFGKSHSPLLELIHKGDKPYAVKNGKAVDSSVYSDVWDEHANHVHVAAGPNTVVALGKLAQQMGLSVGENVYFTGKKPARGVHAGESYHYRQGTTKSGKAADEAIDVSGDPRKMNQFAAQVERLYGLGG